MAVRSEGEFELVLGNRQLFSVLGIVVILLGIFFAMGFFAGKTVGQASTSSTAAQSPINQEPPAVDSSNNAKATAPPAPVPAVEEPAALSESEKDTVPNVEDKSASPEKKEPAASRKEAPPQAKSAASKGPDQVVKPAAGSYLQVASTRLSEAQSLAALLRKNQFRVVLAESPKAELIRVLVGPFSTPEATTEARAKLKSLGIAKPYPVKY